MVPKQPWPRSNPRTSLRRGGWNGSTMRKRPAAAGAVLRRPAGRRWFTSLGSLCKSPARAFQQHKPSTAFWLQQRRHLEQATSQACSQPTMAASCQRLVMARTLEEGHVGIPRELRQHLQQTMLARGPMGTVAMVAGLMRMIGAILMD